ncbi:MAG: serine hydrolase [Rikenellaceae bacterium]
MRLLTTILILTLVNSALFAQPLKKVLPESVGMSSVHLEYADSAIEKEISSGHIPGAVLAVVKDGAIAYIKAYGKKSLTPSIEPMDENTIFDLASCTKSVSTAISAMILVERGKLSLRDNLDLYIPDFNKTKSYNGRRCTIKIGDLMTHTSGITSYVSPKTLQSKYGKSDAKALIEYTKSANLEYETGKDFKYSCINYILLQYIIEQITKQSLQEFANENIFDKLQMNNTDYLPLEWADKSDIAPTEVVSRDSVIRGVVHDPLAYHVNNGVSGNSGLFSTASDLAILATTILSGGIYNGKRILSPITVDAMCRVPNKVASFGRALGWDVSSAYSSNIGDLFGDGSFGHTGFTGCSITLDKEHNVAVILLTNGIHAKEYESKYMVRLRALVANCVAASIYN